MATRVDRPCILAVGDNCLDFYVDLGRAFPGGGAVNLAVQAARLGAKSTYLGVIGTDLAGQQLQTALFAEGVDATWLLRHPGQTAVAYVRLVNGERAFLGKYRGVRRAVPLPKGLARQLSQFSLVHTTLDGCVDPLLCDLKNQGLLVSYDFSHRSTTEQHALLPLVDFAFFSGSQKSEPEIQRLLERAWQKGPRVLVITLGHRGAIARDARGTVYQPAIPMVATDTLGAGDAFQAAFLLTYLRTCSTATALAAGCRYAASVLGHHGAFGHGLQAAQLGLTPPQEIG